MTLYANKFSGPGVKWYASQTGGNPLATTREFITPLLSTTTTYYAASYDASTGCEQGYRVGATASIIKPQVNVSDKMNCGPGQVVLEAVPVASGDVVQWFDSPVGGNAIATGLSFTTPLLTTSKAYYVSAYNVSKACEAPVRTTITAKIVSIPSAPVVAGQRRIGPGDITFSAQAPPFAIGIAAMITACWELEIVLLYR